MTMNPLPPQAYTKETMLKAYSWLTKQNDSIKEMATTPDILVSLYLKATRDGDHSLERPSIQNFKNELKSLAGMMGDLDRPQANPTVIPPLMNAMPQPGASQTLTFTEKTVTATTRTPEILELLDSNTRGMIREVKDEFNLSTDLDALRMLVKIGYNKTQNLMK